MVIAVRPDFADDIPIDLARRAHGHTSHVPEQRADQERAGYASTLAADMAALAALATTEEKREILAAEFARYRAGYATRVRAYLDARSRCASAMITGPARFPVERNRKRNAIADRRNQEADDFRARALAAIRRALTPELAPIMAGDDDATARLRDKLAKLERLQDDMKAANTAIRKHAKAGADAQIAALAAIGYASGAARDLLAPDFAGRIGFADYQIRNNGAEIRRLRARLESVTAAKATPDARTEHEHAAIEESAAANRIRLFFPGKPDRATRDRLKRNGFRWAPSLNAWQAYLSGQTRAFAHNFAGAPIAAAPAAEVAA
jgi:hypothetical protein